MPLRPAAFRIPSLVALALLISGPSRADDLKPVPPVAIPDDPPPHEGALFEFPLTIDAPDIIVVEVLEALPGMPITGERLVRPDGTISLGFYGDVHVRGLTTRQAKVKIIHQLRKHLVDDVLGLTEPAGTEKMPPLGKPGSPVPESELRRFLPEEGEGPLPFLSPPVPHPLGPNPPGAIDPPGPEKVPPPASAGKPSAGLLRREGSIRRVSRPSQDPKPLDDEKPAGPEKKDEKPQKPDGPNPPEGMEGAIIMVPHVYIDPADSVRVFVDFAAHNSMNYYVQGDVGKPGRLPFTGKETVLDALNYAGGFIPTAEPADIHLYRPARGGKPAKDYKIDLDAIQKGDARANLQVFPGDRLIVGRNPIVKKTIEVDRANSLLNSFLNTTLQYAFTARSLSAINSPSGNAGPPGQADSTAITPARRDAMLREWVDFMWSISSQEGGAMLDEKAFRDALLEKFRTVAEPKK